MWCCNLTVILQLTGFEVLADLQVPVSTPVSSWAVYGQNCKKNISRAHFPLDQPFILRPILYCADAKKLISLQTWATYWWDHHDASKQYSHTKRLTCHILKKRKLIIQYERECKWQQDIWTRNSQIMKLWSYQIRYVFPLYWISMDSWKSCELIGLEVVSFVN